MSTLQPHACFIQSVSDDLVNEGGIMICVRGRRVSSNTVPGTGTNFSALRGENEMLSGGGHSSGLMSFLEDRRSRRGRYQIRRHHAPRRRRWWIVDVDHPDIEDFINWKVIEEQKVAAMVAGSKLAERHLKAVLKLRQLRRLGRRLLRSKKNPALRREIKAARKSMIPDNFVERVISFAKQGYKDIDFRTYDTDWDSEADPSVSRR